MDGLLDFVKTPEGQGLLAAAFGGLAGARRGQPLNSIGRAGLAGLQGYGNAQDRLTQQDQRDFEKQYKTAQLSKLEQEMEAARKQAAFIESLGNPSSAALGTGAASGDVGPTVGNATRMDGISKIPKSALQADLALNKGKNVSEWLFKTGVPDMNVSGGYAYDKNRVAPGFLPQFNMSNDGKATFMQPGADGKPFVSAAPGAVDAFSAFANAGEDAKASRDLVSVPTSDGRTRTMSRAEAINATSGNSSPVPTSYPTKGNARISPELLGLIQADAAKYGGGGEPVINLNSDKPGAIFTVGNPAQIGVAPSAAESDAAKSRVEVNSASQAARAKDVRTANQFLLKAQQAQKLLDEGPTQSGIGSLIDSAASTFGVTTKGAATADSLKAVGGWLVANVPRMEGPQSNFDVENYRTMAGNVANEKLPIERRKAALNEVMSMMQSIVDGEMPSQPGAKTIVKTGVYGGKKVVKYSDGSVEYAD